MTPNPYDPVRAATGRTRAQRTPSLARRVFPMVALGGAAGVLVMALDHPGSGAASPDTVSAGGTVAVDPSATDNGTLIVDPGSNTATSTVPATPQRSTATTAAATTPETTATSKAANSSTCRAYRGPVEDNRFGPVQVQASVSSSGKICSVKVLQSPTGGKSDRINARAVPTLNKQAMAAQSANINGVSGATYTTIGYIDSLQAILDAAKG